MMVLALAGSEGEIMKRWITGGVGAALAGLALSLAVVGCNPPATISEAPQATDEVTTTVQETGLATQEAKFATVTLAVEGMS